MDIGSAPAELPKNIEASSIYRAGGYLILHDLLSSAETADLHADAEKVRAVGTRCLLEHSDGAEERGGNPARAFRLAPGSQRQWDVLSSALLLHKLSQIVGATVAPLGGGSFIYYEAPGDFLALHRDIVTCDLALITALNEPAPEQSSGGLLVYPEFIARRLSMARKAGRQAATAVRLQQGETVLLLGGVVPHEVAPMFGNQERVVSVMCYRFPTA